jgi:hypothetical protein
LIKGRPVLAQDIDPKVKIARADAVMNKSRLTTDNKKSDAATRRGFLTCRLLKQRALLPLQF